MRVRVCTRAHIPNLASQALATVELTPAMLADPGLQLLTAVQVQCDLLHFLAPFGPHWATCVNEIV